MKKWLSRLSKIAFVFLALFAILITVFVNMGGNNHTLRGALEEYIAQSTGFAAQITKLNKMTFFPDIGADVEGILMKRPDPQLLKAWAEAENQKPPEQRGQTPPPIHFEEPDGSIGKLKIVMGFWDVTFGMSKKVRDIQVANAYFKAGALAHKAVTLRTLGIEETPEGNAYLNAKGLYGDDGFNAQVDLETGGSRNRPNFKIGEESAFEASIAELHMKGIMRPRRLGGFHIRDVLIKQESSEILEAALSFVRSQDKSFAVKGDMLLLEHGTDAKIDWQIGGEGISTISGEIKAAHIDTRDFNENAKLLKFLKRWNEIFFDPEEEGQSLTGSLIIDAETFQDGASELSNYKGILTIKDDQFIFQQTQK